MSTVPQKAVKLHHSLPLASTPYGVSFGDNDYVMKNFDSILDRTLGPVLSLNCLSQHRDSYNKVD